MRAEELFAVLGELDGDLVEEAMPGERRRTAWKVWGAAACLCLVIGAAVLSMRPSAPGGGVGGNPGGMWPDGVDPVIASVAVFPAERDVREVENAVCISLEEAEVLTQGLAEHLPETLPDGLSFRSAELYETTMRDGAVYHMLRVHYTDGEFLPSGMIDGETGEPIPGALRDVLSVFVMDYRPDTSKTIRQAEELSDFLTGQWEGGTFHFACGEVYIGVTPNGAELGDILAVTAAVS